MSKYDDYKIRILLIERKKTNSSTDPNQQNSDANSSQNPNQQQNSDVNYSQNPNQQNSGANISQNWNQQYCVGKSSQNQNQQNLNTNCCCKHNKTSLANITKNTDKQTMATCQEKSVMDKCICFDLKYKLIYLNLDRMLRRLPDIAVDKLNHKFIGLVLEELDSTVPAVDESPEDTKSTKRRLSASDAKPVADKKERTPERRASSSEPEASSSEQKKET